jgi:hypothetical protein
MDTWCDLTRNDGFAFSQLNNVKYLHFAVSCFRFHASTFIFCALLLHRLNVQAQKHVVIASDLNDTKNARYTKWTHDAWSKRTIHEQTKEMKHYPMTNDPGSIEVQYSIVLLFEWLLCKMMWLTNLIFYTVVIASGFQSNLNLKKKRANALSVLLASHWCLSHTNIWIIRPQWHHETAKCKYLTLLSCENAKTIVSC